MDIKQPRNNPIMALYTAYMTYYSATLCNLYDFAKVTPHARHMICYSDSLHDLSHRHIT